MAQQRNGIVFFEDADRHLKLVGKLHDQVCTVFFYWRLQNNVMFVWSEPQLGGAHKLYFVNTTMFLEMMNL